LVIAPSLLLPFQSFNRFALVKTFKAFRARVFEAAKESSNLTEKSPWPVSFRYGLAEVARGMIAQTNVPAKMSSKLF